jgi:hypothetical protein
VTTEEATNPKELNFSRLNKKIAELDGLLESMKERIAVFKDDLNVYDRIVEAQDALFRLAQTLRGGCVIVEFGARWLDLEEREDDGF